MNDSILTSIKKLLGIQAEMTHFDEDVLVGINLAINTLSQIGLESAKNFVVNGVEELWSDFVSDHDILSTVKTYIHLKVKMVFDPTNGTVVSQSYENMIKECEWRIRHHIEEN